MCRNNNNLVTNSQQLVVGISHPLPISSYLPVRNAVATSFTYRGVGLDVVNR
jgi:hypothetical protein